MLSPTERTLRARAGGHMLHAVHDTMTVSAPGRAAARSKLDQELLGKIDPHNKLSESERTRRLDHARKSHFSTLAMRAATVRRKKAGAR